MKVCKFLTVAAFLQFAVIAPLASAESDTESDLLSVATNVDIMSDYMFRGFNLYDGISVQPSIDLSADLEDLGSVDFSTWAHLSAEGGRRTSEENFTEVDYTLSYSYSTDLLAFTLGHAFYTYPRSSDDTEDTNEVFVSVGADVLLAPTITVFRDYDQYDTEYYELSFSHEVTPEFLGDGFNATPYVAFGFATNSEKVYSDNGLVQVTTGLSFSTKLGDIDVIPAINYTFESDDSLENQFWAGTSFSYTF